MLPKDEVSWRNLKQANDLVISDYELLTQEMEVTKWFIDKDYELSQANSSSNNSYIVPAAIQPLLATSIVCNLSSNPSVIDRACL